MSAIAINTQYVTLTPTGKIKEHSKGFTGRLCIISMLDEISIYENDQVIIATPTLDKDLKFESDGIITKVNEIKKVTQLNLKNTIGNQNPPKDRFEHYFSIEITKELKNNSLLSDLEYSLQSVYRFSKPIVHFQQQFRNLTKQDYDTIVRGWIYYSRTAFGKLVNSIPRQNKLELMLQAMDHFSTVNFKDVSLYQGLDFLYKYIDKRILSRGRLLIETNNLLKKHLSDILPQEEIGFYNPENKKTDNISKQAGIFEDLFKLEKQSDVRKLIRENISEDSQLEQRFMQIFKLETWPIDLSI